MGIWGNSFPEFSDIFFFAENNFLPVGLSEGSQMQSYLFLREKAFWVKIPKNRFLSASALCGPGGCPHAIVIVGENWY